MLKPGGVERRGGGLDRKREGGKGGEEGRETEKRELLTR